MSLLGIIASQNYPRITGSYESIATVSVGSGGQATIEFTSIPGTYTHLQIRGIGRGDFAGGGAGVKINLNGNTGSNYIRHNLDGDGSTVTASASAASTTFASIGTMATVGSADASEFGVTVFDLLDYTNTNKNRTMRALTGFDSNGSGVVELRSNLYTSTTAVTSITLAFTSGNFAQYSSFALYGIKGV